MYQQDQNRADSNQGMHFHVHQCVCTSPLYNPYRQPMIAPYVPPPPVARPYNLAHYQYTSYNIPYNVPVFNPTAIAAHPVAPASTSIPDSVRLESNESAPMRNADDAEDFQGNDALTEDFTKFLEQGCIIAEKIAIRNQHRPCFKNIQNLCNRTKNEIMKPSHTVSNIHSQGIPWATKDFIYAYVRLINCWHMLKGYLQAKDGALGNIDRELTTEFKNCYSVWEGNTKDLAEHMIRIFSNLDNNVSNPSPNNQQFVNRPRVARPVPPNLLVDNNTPTVEASTPLHIDDANQFSETTTEPSPREEESDGEGRVYMKPGSYNVPKKNDSSENNSPPSIEFFETAKNIAAHYRKIEEKKQSEAVKKQSENAEKEWRNAISATPVLIKRNACSLEGRFDEMAPHTIDVDNIRRWLYHDHFDQQNLAYPMSEIRIGMPERQVTLLQRDCKSKEEINKSNEIMDVMDIKRNIFKSKSFLAKIDRDQESMKLLLDELEKTQFNKTLVNENQSLMQDTLENLQTMLHKYNCQYYKCPMSLVQDLRRMITNSKLYFNTNPDTMKQVSEFSSILDDALERLFPDDDFNDGMAELEDLEASLNAASKA